MSYVDGFVLAVPTANREAYLDLARKFSALLAEWGAIRQVECWGDDVPEGEVTSFRMAVKQADDETVVFSWTEWPDKPTRDTAMQKMMDDPRMQELGDMPFDGKRIIFGGFEPVFETRAGG